VPLVLTLFGGTLSRGSRRSRVAKSEREQLPVHEFGDYLKEEVRI